MKHRIPSVSLFLALALACGYVQSDWVWDIFDIGFIGCFACIFWICVCD